jgi:hypothetical protein
MILSIYVYASSVFAQLGVEVRQQHLRQHKPAAPPERRWPTAIRYQLQLAVLLAGSAAA